jgi:hypothetical protein
MIFDSDFYERQEALHKNEQFYILYKHTSQNHWLIFRGKPPVESSTILTEEDNQILDLPLGVDGVEVFKKMVEGKEVEDIRVTNENSAKKHIIIFPMKKNFDANLPISDANYPYELTGTNYIIPVRDREFRPRWGLCNVNRRGYIHRKYKQFRNEIRNIEENLNSWFYGYLRFYLICTIRYLYPSTRKNISAVNYWNLKSWGLRYYPEDPTLEVGYMVDLNFCQTNGEYRWKPFRTIRKGKVKVEAEQEIEEIVKKIFGDTALHTYFTKSQIGFILRTPIDTEDLKMKLQALALYGLPKGIREKLKDRFPKAEALFRIMMISS